MCFGGGGGQNTVSTTQVETLPEELVPFYEDLLDRGTYQSLTGYTPYPGRRIAEFDPYESGAQDAYAEMALAGTPESFTESQAVAREAAIGSPYQRAMRADQATQEMMRGVGEYRRERPQFADFESSFGDFTDTRELTLPERRGSYFSSLEEQQSNPYVQQMNAISEQLSGIDPASGEGAQLQADYEGLQTQLDESMADMDFGQGYSVMEEYMNPFQQTFVDRQKRMAREESERQQNEIAAQATMAGGLGGYREGVMQSERERNLGNQLQDIQATGDIQNYQQARQAFEADRLANVGRAEFNRAGLSEAAQLGMEGYAQLGGDIDRRLMAGQRMSDLTGTRQAMEVSRLGQLEAAGQRRRALGQQGLDMGYGDFLRQQTFPIEQLNLYSSMLRGLPVGPGQSQAVYGTQPSAMQQMVGAGISGVGLYNAMSGGGGGGWGGT
jgi:hypothetical protein